MVYEIDPIIERQKIKEQIIKDKLKLFEMLMREIQDIVHSAYNRAYGGQERKTLRQHIHISETMSPNQQQRGGDNGGTGFFKRR